MRSATPRSYLVVIVLGLLLGLSPGCASAPPAPSATLPPATLAPLSGSASAPRSGGTVTVYSALSETTNADIIAAFERAQPVISVQILSLAAAGELQNRIRAEQAAPRADIFLGGSSEYHEILAREGLLEAYRSPNAALIDPGLKDSSGYWTGWYVGIFGILINTEQWPREMPGRAEPSSWDDLIDPALAGKLAMPDPVKTGGGYISLVNQVFRFNRNEARAMDYLKRLHQNVGEYTGTSPQTIELVGNGKYPVGLNWGHDVLTAAAAGQPLKFVAPEDTAYEIGAASIVRGGPNPSGARAFIDWVLSRESAELIVKSSNRLSALSRVQPAPGAPTLESVKLSNYDRAWATENRERLLAQWRAAVGR